MSDAESSRELETEAEPPTHPIGLREIHTGDVARVTTEDVTLDPAAVIAVWPYYQEDFDDERHTDDVYTRRSATKDHTKENPVWEPDIKHMFNGIRVTFQTEDGGRYAVVDWGKTDDPPLVYLLVIDDADPERRRWEKIGRDPTVVRYGEPVEDRGRDWWGNLPSEDIDPWVVEQDAEPDFTLPGGQS